MEKKWVMLPKSNSRISGALQEELGIHPVLVELLVQRSIQTFEEAKTYFRPELEQLHDPFLMKDMDVAITRIEEAMGRKEKILVYGDYDVDGTTAVSVLFGFLSKFYAYIEYYLPDRYAEGYGLSFAGVDYAIQNDFGLIITLDCGIKEHDKVRYAHENGIDVIIGDHHLPGDELPQALAVLDPKRLDCAYPYKELSGCGIAFKIVQAFIIKNDMAIREAYEFLDLVAVSIASDIVPITGENRVLAYFGLKKLNRLPCCGLEALIQLSGKETGRFTINDILFQIGPRINAAGRIEHARDAVRLLLSKTLKEAVDFSEEIDIQNNQRKDFDAKITEEAMKLIDDSENLQNRKSTVLFKPDWHKGVIGIVASRLTEKYYRPTIILTQSNGHVTGSARSVVGFDLYEALTECEELLDQYGGHKYAAGLTMQAENVPSFQEKFEKVVSSKITEEMLIQEITIDSELKLKEIDAKFFRILKQFEPTGPENEQAVFLTKRVKVCGVAQVVGVNHLKMSVFQDSSSSFDCIGFGLANFASTINEGLEFDICYTIHENVWREKRNLQLVLKGIRF